MKRIIPILLIVCILVVSLVACADKAEETQTETAEVVTTKPRPTTTPAPITDGISTEDDGWSYWDSF